MPCKKCGYNLGAVARFCPSCGLTVDETPQAYNSPAGNWPAPYQAPGTSPAMSPPPAPTAPAPLAASPMAGDAYYLMLNGQQSGPFTVNQMKSMWQSGTINAGIYYWQAGMSNWQPLANIRQFLDAPALNSPAGQIIVNQVNSQVSSQINAPMAYHPFMVQSTKSRAAFIVLGLFFGCFGVHNFYAGHVGRGIAQLLITMCLGIFIIGFAITGFWALIEIIAVTTDGRGLRMT